MKRERMKGEVEPETKKFRLFRDFNCDAIDEEDAFQQFEEWEEHLDYDERIFYTWIIEEKNVTREKVLKIFELMEESK